MLLSSKITPKTPEVSLIQARISFLKQCELSGLSDKYFHVIKYTTQRLLRFTYEFDLINISDLSPKLAMDYFSRRSQDTTHIHYRSYDDNKRKKVSNETLNKELQILRRFCRHCIDMGWMDINPFRSIRSFKVDSHKQRYYFTDTDIETIMGKAGKFKDFYTLLLHTGLRSTDAYKLKKKHIQGRYLCIQMNKTKDTLNIPLPDTIIPLLKVILEDISGENDLLFPHFQTNRQRRNCCKVVQGCFDIEMVRKNNINLHTFRHTYAHNMLNKGVPKEVLQTLLGHRSIKTTEIYANWVRKEELERWV
ncbi:MAG: tyrosine-type recombinase/integrase [Candidatus Marinimicrobia bacterium]|nr:tyrosine-type recombinase/integrase [Candidatus Neomarinimicrobiota bacterium]